MFAKSFACVGLTFLGFLEKNSQHQEFERKTRGLVSVKAMLSCQGKRGGLLSSSQGRRWPVGSECVSTNKGILYRVAAELGEAAQLCVFILGRWYLYPGVLRHVFGFRHASSVLVIMYL